MRHAVAAPTTPVVVFDLETGGLIPGKHPIIQIAAVTVDASNQWTEISSWERKLRFEASAADPKALEVNQHNPEVWAREAVDPAQAFREFGRYLERYRSVELISPRTGRPYQVTRVAGYNVRFDLDHIGAAFRGAGLFFPGKFNTALDVLQGVLWGQVRGELPLTKDQKLTTVAEALGVKVEGSAHDALVDVRLTIGVARVLLGCHKES